ncbi:helix-turn-helix domain-containing protein, partial [Burkholderia cenocepacia]|uniref:helix-turn-helix domain-containing protein n=1 Tax=Burkholderia cenocepacia TaxID=95486 RepID=UPI00286F1AE8
LRRSPEKVTGATELANRFNLRHRGAQPVSPQTAHKWLTGRTIPTPDKLATLADWLRVEVHWLHYGPSPSVIEHATPQPLPRDEHYPPTPETIELASFRRLRTRFERRADIHEAFLKLGCSLVCWNIFRRAEQGF